MTQDAKGEVALVTARCHHPGGLWQADPGSLIRRPHLCPHM
jgi:hypothetical protein